MSAPLFETNRLTSWAEAAEALDYMTRYSWVFRGQESAAWGLQTTIEREFGARAAELEPEVLWRFIRMAPRLVPAHLIPHDSDVAAWLGLIQHYGGPTRFLDVTRSPYIALFFAFERNSDEDRAVWVIDYAWCMSECSRIMAEAEHRPWEEMFGRAAGAQAQLVYSVVHRRPFRDQLFESFKLFTGVFPVDPWKPDARQSAQQALFLCAANLDLDFTQNLAAHAPANRSFYRFVLPASLREEILDRLAAMNVSAATLFPDLSGLARSLRTHVIRRKATPVPPPWEVQA